MTLLKRWWRKLMDIVRPPPPHIPNRRPNILYNRPTAEELVDPLEEADEREAKLDERIVAWRRELGRERALERRRFVDE